VSAVASVLRRASSSGPSSFSFADLEREARQMHDRADAEARQIVQQAQAHAREIAEQAGQDGYRTGLAEGHQAGLRQIRAEAHEAVLRETRERLDQLLQALTAGLAEFERSKRRLISLAEAGLIELAVSIAQRVCKLAVQGSANAAWANARYLLEAVQHTEDLELRVNPAEYELLRDVAADVLQHAERLKHVEVLADEAVEPGGCVLSTRDGQVDASIETQLQRIAEAILQGGQREPAEPSTDN
jgi:flagellar assembly protein FliH